MDSPNRSSRNRSAERPNRSDNDSKEMELTDEDIQIIVKDFPFRLGSLVKQNLQNSKLTYRNADDLKKIILGAILETAPYIDDDIPHQIMSPAELNSFHHAGVANNLSVNTRDLKEFFSGSNEDE